MDKGLAVFQDDKAIEIAKARNMRIAREMVVNGRKLTDQQLEGRAAFAAQQGLDVVSEVHTLTDGNGNTSAHTMSINGLRRKNQEALGGFTIDLQFLPLPADQMDAKWAYAYECHLRDGKSYREWQDRLLSVGRCLRDIMGQVDYKTIEQACGPAPVTIGVGIVFKSELNDFKDSRFNPIERAKKRAEVNARHHRFPTCAPVEDDGEISGFSAAASPAPVMAVAKLETEAQLINSLGYEADEPAEVVDTTWGPEGAADGAPHSPTTTPEEVLRAGELKTRSGKRLAEMKVDELTEIKDKAASMTESAREKAREFLSAVDLMVDWNLREVA